MQSSGTATGLALAGAVTTTIANFGIAWIVAGVGASYAGVFFATTALVAILANSSGLGTMTGLVYFMPTVLQGPHPNPRSLVGLAIRPVLTAATIAAAVLFFAAVPVADVVSSERATEVASLLRLLAVVIPAWALTMSLLGATRGLGSMTPTVAINQVFKPLGQLFAIAAVALFSDTPSTVAIAVAWGAPVVAASGLAAVSVWRLGGFAGPGRVSGPGRCSVSAQEFWRFTRPRSLSTTFQIALERIDVILVSILAGEAAAGIYGTITRFITAGNFLIFSIGQATAPGIRRALSDERRTSAQRLLHQATGWMVALAWPYFLLVATKASGLIELLNAEFTTASTALSLLAVAMLASAFAGPIDLTLLMLGRSRWSLAAIAAALVTDIGVAWIAVPRMGVVGAAIAWAAAVFVQNGLATLVVDRVGELRAPGSAALTAAVGAVVCVVPIGLITSDSFIGLLVSGLVAGVLYLGWLMRFADRLDLPPALALPSMLRRNA